MVGALVDLTDSYWHGQEVIPIPGMIFDHANLRHVGNLVVEVNGVVHVLPKVIQLLEFGLLEQFLNPLLAVE